MLCVPEVGQAEEPMWGALARTQLTCVGAVAVILLSPASAGSAPTGLIDVGGYRLFIDCKGKGSPTVVLDAGLGGSGANWIDVSTARVQDDACVLLRSSGSVSQRPTAWRRRDDRSAHP